MDEVVKKILKRRNLAIALLHMASSCSSNCEAKTSTCSILAFLLVKKATSIITQLAKLLKVGRNAEMIIDERIREQFYRSKHFQ
jgi:hypothetical protein